MHNVSQIGGGGRGGGFLMNEYFQMIVCFPQCLAAL